MPSESFCQFPAQRSYAGPSRPATMLHIAQQRQCVIVAGGASGPRQQDLLRNVKPGMADMGDPLQY